jgi:hypothetical protein
MAPGTAYMSNSPAAVLFNNNTYVFYQGYNGNGQLWYSVFSGSTCTTVTTQVPNVSMSQSPTAVVFNSTLYVFYQQGGSNQTLGYCYTTDGSTWTVGSTTNNLSGSNYTPAISPSAVVFNNTIYIFFSVGGAGSIQSGQFSYCTFNGTNWSSLSTPSLGNPIDSDEANMTDSPSAVVMNGQLYVFLANPQNQSQLWYTVSSNGKNWSSIAVVGSTSVTQGPGGARLAEALTTTESVFLGTGFTVNPFVLDF